MKKNIYFIVLLSLLSLTILSQVPNYSVTTAGGFNMSGEPYLAINPTNPKNMIIGWMCVTQFSPAVTLSIKTATTSNGGSTWSTTHTFTHTAANWTSADVSIAFRNNGTAYLSYIDYNRFPKDTAFIYIVNSINGGTSWSAPVKVWNSGEDWHMQPIDRPWLAVDNSNSVNRGTFYMTTKPAVWVAGSNHRPYLKTSSDSGQTWSPYIYVDNAPYSANIKQPMATLCVAADGALSMAYSTFTGKEIFAKSYNKGSTITYTNLLNPAPFVGPSDTLSKLGTNITANPLKPGHLSYILTGDTTTGKNDHDIFVTNSYDGGTTWSPYKRINDDPPGRDQDMAWINYSTNNKLVAVWRDRRNAPGTGYKQPTEIYCSMSLDSGKTFQPNVKLSNLAAPHYTILETSGNDFLSCQLLNDTIYATWGDARTGNLNIYFIKTSFATGLGIAPVLVNAPEISFYPNPVNDKLFYKYSNSEMDKANISVYNISGQLVLKGNIDKHNNYLDVKNLKVGTYFLKVEKNNQLIYSDKIIISD